MNKQQLASKIWASANKMRSKIEANEYKDYILGFIFYKFLSDQEEAMLRKDGWSDTDIEQELVESDLENKVYVQRKLGYFICNHYLFSVWIKPGASFDASIVTDALNAFERNIYETHHRVFDKIFDTLSTGLSKLGETNGARTKAILELLKLIKDIPTDESQGYDVLGFIYEYLISNFAANAGKKAGEFYTPHEVAMLMAEIVSYHLRSKNNIEIYDPTSGSGSLLINIGKAASKHLRSRDNIKYYAQELKENTYNLTRMNLVMRGIKPANIQVRCGDTLDKDWPWFDDKDPLRTYNPLYVDAVVSNPPYSQQWDNSNKDTDARYADFGVAPKGKADYAFLLHDLYHIKPDGIMTIVLPHGVLFRGKEEGEIRKNLIEKNHIDAIIGLPANIFFGTGIPTIIMVLRQKRQNTDVLFIDGSRLSVKVGKRNKLTASDIRRIADTFIERNPSDQTFARIVTRQEIRDNGYNLNIPRYIESADVPETWDLYSTMFGGIPKAEIALLQKYWEALPGLENALYNPSETPYTSMSVEDIRLAIEGHDSVKAFKKSFAEAFGTFNTYLHGHLIDGMLSLNIAGEEEAVTKHIFERLQSIPLVDKYEAYQLFASKWEEISQDLEIIQTEGFQTTKQVDANMVIKKKGDKEEEVQDGWKGHVLPFELVQPIFLKYDWERIQKMKEDLEKTASEIDAAVEEFEDDEKELISDDDGKISPKEAQKKLDSLRQEIDTPEIHALHDYSCLHSKPEKLSFVELHPEVNWDEMDVESNGTYKARTVALRISDLVDGYPFPVGSFESKLLHLTSLFDNAASLRQGIKRGEANMHEETKRIIEHHLSDANVLELLEVKWIDGLCQCINELPRSIIDSLVQKVVSLDKKYAVTLVDVEKDIRSASNELHDMIDDLTGDEYNMRALKEFQKTLKEL